MPIKKFSKVLLFAIIDSIRMQLGPRGVCVYRILHKPTCRKYIKHTLNNRPLYIGLPLIFLRLLSCNPITGLFFRLKSRKRR